MGRVFHHVSICRAVWATTNGPSSNRIASSVAVRERAENREFGDGTTTRRLSPILVPGLTDIVSP